MYKSNFILFHSSKSILTSKLMLIVVSGALEKHHTTNLMVFSLKLVIPRNPENVLWQYFLDLGQKLS